MMRLSTALLSLAAALGAAQLVGVVITPGITTSNATLSLLASQTHSSEQAPISSVTAQTTLAVEPVTAPIPHAAPHPPHGHVFASAGDDQAPGHACQVTSHCPGGAESDEVLAAFKEQVRDVPGYCSYLSLQVSKGFDTAGNGTG